MNDVIEDSDVPLISPHTVHSGNTNGVTFYASLTALGDDVPSGANCAIEQTPHAPRV
eukprot:CAMPEP_0176417800 /NCGR_PEP_ID=MMETSP0127-20121128/7088_1 /TAXON_ID=938130 /ORGANISM="Platyophrya macrostoma, Strain WH" /LENGTH=56 /DNA_ID=CAMNT_0017797997 /DNA_START=583 /DNA_END=749 /DNA_ORIENTATION=-